MAKKKEENLKTDEKVKKILKDAASSKDKKQVKTPSDKEEFLKLEEKLLRTVAEMENLRKRTEKEMEEARKFAVTGFARDLLEVLDNLERAQKNIPQDELEKNEVLKSINDGIKMTSAGLMVILEKHGIKRIDPRGEKFDHNLHQAVVEIPDEKSEPGTVIQVMQAGYVIKDRLLRPAMVGVAKAKA